MHRAKKKILKLLSSHQPANIALAIELMQSQKVDFPELIDACGQMSELINCKHCKSPYAQVEEVFKEENYELGAKGLTEIPKAFKYFSKLESIRLCDNDIRQIPNWMPKVKGICIHGNKNLDINSLNTLKASINVIEWICMMSLDLKFFPEFLKDCKSLTGLAIGDNPIETIPEYLGELTNLTILGLPMMDLEEVPYFLGNLTKLENLVLFSNKITKLPNSFGQLKMLKELELQYNKLSEVPPVVFELPNLRKLYLEGNSISAAAIFLAQEALPNCRIIV